MDDRTGVGQGTQQGLNPHWNLGVGGRGGSVCLRADLHVVNAFGLCIHHEKAIIQVLFGPPPVQQKGHVQLNSSTCRPTDGGLFYF